VGALGFIGFIGSALAAIALGALPGHLSGRSRALAGAVAIVVFAASITAFALGEDTYIADGSSRWSNRGFSQHVLYVIVAASAVTVAVLLVALAARRRNAVIVRTLLVFSGGAAFVTGFAVLVAFASN
jgi:hypothetical protein